MDKTLVRRIVTVSGPILVLLYLSVSLHSSVYAATTTDDSTTVCSDIPETVLRDARIVLNDGIAWVLAPLSFKGNDWLLFAGVGTAAVATYATDASLRSVLQQHQDKGWSDAAGIANEGGQMVWAGGITAACYLPGLLLGIDELRVTGRMLGQSLLYAGAVSLTIRIVLGRDRPYSGKGPSSFGWWELENAKQSMPSGHTTIAFAMASVLSRRIEHPLATALLYVAASATGLARLYHDQHWGSDVLLGAVIGHTAGMFVASKEDKRHTGEGDLSYGWSVLPSPAGLTVMYRF